MSDPAQPPSNQRFSRDIRHLEATGSTNADMLGFGRNGEPEGVVLVTDVQTAGRGRHDRDWIAPAGSALLMSILLRPPAAVAGLVTATLAVAAHDTVEDFGATVVGIKWPNDLVADVDRSERKLAGILAEADWPHSANISAGWRAPRPDERILVIAGLGMNLITQTLMPADVAERAVALDALTDTSFDRDAVLAAFLESFGSRYSQLISDPASLVDAWRRRCVTLGRRVRLDLGVEDAEGTAVDLDEEGHLVVDLIEGGQRSFTAGDVIHLRR